MKSIRGLTAIVVAFVLLQGTDFLIHAVMLSSYYADSKELWRPEDEMMSLMWSNYVGHLLMAIAVVLLFSFSVVSNGGGIKCALLFAATLTLMNAGVSFIMWGIQPLPASYHVIWMIATLVQLSLVSIALYFVFPRKKEG